MKRYKVEYCEIDRSKPRYLTEISKSGKWSGNTVSLTLNGKNWQEKLKNNLLNGIDKWWEYSKKNIHFQNWKKHKTQGIKISFK